VAVHGQPGPALAWDFTAYAQAEDFSSTFSGVDPARASETPAADQYAVPATALGVSWAGRWTGRAGAQLSAGVDARQVRGETRELYSFNGDTFARRRLAGGAQSFAGAFAEYEQELGAGVTARAGLRVDRWGERDGHLQEMEIASGAVSRDDAFANRSGWALGPSAGVVWRVNDRVRLRAAAQHAFRRPTLNELYRPFRVGSILTAGNAALRTETVTGAEAGVDVGGQGPWALGVTAFHNELHDAVANVTVAHGPGNVPDIGFIPAGGLGRRRMNLDRVVVRGVEPTLTWRAERWSVKLAYLYDDAVVRSAAVAPALVGKRLAQVPRHSATASVTWRPERRWTIAPRLRWIGAQFEDDENQLRLAPVVVLDVGLSWEFAPRWTWFANIENAGDARIETGRSATDVVNVGTPRLATTGIRTAW